MHVFIDASGSPDISQKYLVIAVVCCEDPLLPYKLLHIDSSKKAKDVVSYLQKSGGEFKFQLMAKDRSPRVRRLLKEKLAVLGTESRLKIIVGSADSKAAVDPVLLFSLFTGFSLKENPRIFCDKGLLKQNFLVFAESEEAPHHLIGFAQDENSIGGLIAHASGGNPKQLKQVKVYPISHVSSHSTKGIQLADLVAGAYFRQLTRHDDEYFSLVSKNADRVELKQK